MGQKRVKHYEKVVQRTILNINKRGNMDKQVSCNILRNLLKYIIVILKLIFLLVIILESLN